MRKLVSAFQRMDAKSRVDLWIVGVSLVCWIGANFLLLYTKRAPHLWLFMPVWMLVLISFLWDSRLREKVIHAQGKLCHHCWYNLTGLPDKHCCPECGRTYDLEEVIGKWRDTYSVRGNWHAARRSRWIGKRTSPEVEEYTPCYEDLADDPGGYLPAIVHDRNNRSAKRLQWFGIGGMIFIMMSFMLWVAFFLPQDYILSGESFGWALVPVVVFVVAIGWVEERRRKALRRKVMALHGRLCEYCTYNLTGLPERYHCPECGKAYDIARTIRKWKRVRFFPWRKWHPLEQPTAGADQGMAD